MTELRIWFLGVFAAALLLNLLCGLVADGTFRKICKLLAGLTMLLVMVRPLLQWDLKNVFSRYEDAFRTVESETQTYQQDLISRQSAIIADKTAAYIAKTASTMGITCEAEVVCEQTEGVPYPTEVSLNIPFHSQLSKAIEQDLAIVREKQHWQGE